MSYTATTSHTYSTADVEIVVRRFAADIAMMAQSSKGVTEAKALDYAHDVEVLAKKGYLKSVDVTLLSGDLEVKASTYKVNRSSGDMETSRPGGALWPQVVDPHLRIILVYTPEYTDAARLSTAASLKVNWQPSHEDRSHAALARKSGRNYASNGFAMQREDFE